ncbi:unnamed protein product [Paramecium primaurelia]|uniref:FCP1 homology domain-containing protein n=1 Tax=Paramecium primaurelia TaxID=5886 RepID=A0A8S1NUE7_PARPR|nr:unnamed protein product [Paramecium primaurelia]
MKTTNKLPPRNTAIQLNYGNQNILIFQNQKPLELRRYTTDAEEMRRHQKSYGSQKRNESNEIQKQPKGKYQYNTNDKQFTENGRQQHVSSLSDSQSQQPPLVMIKCQAKPQFENFKNHANAKNHNFITQQQRNEKPHSFKQITQVNNKNLSNCNKIIKFQVYYIGDLQNAILNQNARNSEMFREHIVVSFTYIPLIQKSVIDNKQIQDKKLNIPFAQNKKYNKTIIFDMDETLMHCNEDENDKCQFKIPIEFEDGERIVAGINIRNFAKEIIQKLSEVCEVMVFTASQDIYANQVINILDPYNNLCYRIFRDNCITIDDNHLIKHLGVLNRDLKNVVIIDNSSCSFAHHLENGIPIISFYNDEKDNQLIKLYRYLCQYILPADDVRPIILSHFKQDKLNQYETVEEAIFESYLFLQFLLKHILNVKVLQFNTILMLLESDQQQESSNINNQQLYKSVYSIRNRRKIYDDNDFKEVVKNFYNLVSELNKIKKISKPNIRKQPKQTKQRNALPTKQLSKEPQNMKRDINNKPGLFQTQQYFNCCFSQQIVSQLIPNFNQTKHAPDFYDKNKQHFHFSRNQTHIQIAYNIYIKKFGSSLVENQDPTSVAKKVMNNNFNPISQIQEEDKQGDASDLKKQITEDNKQKPLKDLVREFQSDQ